MQGFTWDIRTASVFVGFQTVPAVTTNVVMEAIFPPLEANSGSELLLRT
jgi:hypothetical protein